MVRHYDYSDNGLEIFGSTETFNRVLYGGHELDRNSKERFFTFAGDLPLFMGASSNFERNTWCHQAKNGMLFSGLALTQGRGLINRHDCYSSWFHNCRDVHATWKHGFIEYELSRFSIYFPDVRVKIAVIPLNPGQGFLVHYDITTDQRVLFCAGFGGITDFTGRFEYHTSPTSAFAASDCENNTAEICGDYAAVTGPDNVKMLIGSSFDMELSVDGGEALSENYPTNFLSEHGGTPCIVRMVRELKPGEQFTGNIVVMRGDNPAELKHWLQHPKPQRALKSAIRSKYKNIALHTPDNLLNQTVTDMVIAMDASWHGNTFYHGAIGYHAPFLGWRNWYAPTLLNWHDRVLTAIRSHFDTISFAFKDEKSWWDGGDRPDLDHEGTQYHHLENSSGKLSALLHRDDIYNMQEVGVDMTLYYLDHSADLELGAEIFDSLEQILAWEERILDPDGDGLYQNYLNTWISDGHSYNGGGCAQASCYNLAANRKVAELGRMLGKEVAIFEKRSHKIQKALQDKLWLEEKGVIAEFIDTIGNRLIHPSPELSTIYLAVDCGAVDMFQAYRMLKFSEEEIEAVKTPNRNGRLSFSSNWRPKKYSTCGIFPAENACLALAYFQIGQQNKAMEIVNGLVDAFSLSHNPGTIRHVLSALGGGDGGDLDFSDVTSTYLRMLIEGLWGLRFRLLSNHVDITPQLPESWDFAELALPNIHISCRREAHCDTLTVDLTVIAKKIIRFPLRFAEIEDICINGESVPFDIEPAIGCCFAVIETEYVGHLVINIFYGEMELPELEYSRIVTYEGNLFSVRSQNGRIMEVKGTDFLEIVSKDDSKVVFRVLPETSGRDIFVLVRQADVQVWLPVDIEIEKITKNPIPAVQPNKMTYFNLEPYFNTSLTEIHQREFRSPRPKGYSIGTRINGRYAWDWNHCGHNTVEINDDALRNCSGSFELKSGLAFATPATGANVACVSLWDNFPSIMEIPLTGAGEELVVFLIGSTNAMQCEVINAELKIEYMDGSIESVQLIYPHNFDDFLVPALQKENEYFYFSNFNHGIAQHISLDSTKRLACLKIQAVANELIVGLLGVTLINSVCSCD